VNFYLVLLRLIHIGSGVFWAGAAVMIAAFIEPTVRASGPEGGRFMQRLVEQRRFSTFMTLAALLNAVSGPLLYWTVSGHLQVSWITSGPGLTLTIGSVAGLVAFVLGLTVNGPTAKQIAALGQEMQTAGEPPSPAQMAKMQTLQEKLRRAGILDAVLLGIAVAGMAIARYMWW
jgi:uncharacterized membrane protein